MKKIYMNPEMEIVDIKINQPLLGASDPVVDSSSDPVDPGTGADAPAFILLLED